MIEGTIIALGISVGILIFRVERLYTMFYTHTQKAFYEHTHKEER